MFNFTHVMNLFSKGGHDLNSALKEVASIAIGGVRNTSAKGT